MVCWECYSPHLQQKFTYDSSHSTQNSHMWLITSNTKFTYVSHHILHKIHICDLSHPTQNSHMWLITSYIKFTYVTHRIQYKIHICVPSHPTPKFTYVTHHILHKIHICDSSHPTQNSHLWLITSYTKFTYVTHHILHKIHICDSSHPIQNSHMCPITSYTKIHICVPSHPTPKFTYVTHHILHKIHICDSSHPTPKFTYVTHHILHKSPRVRANSPNVCSKLSMLLEVTSNKMLIYIFDSFKFSSHISVNAMKNVSVLINKWAKSHNSIYGTPCMEVIYVG